MTTTADMVCERLEWEAVRLGPSMSPQNHKVAQRFQACPFCYGVRPGDHVERFFPKHMIGHSPTCLIGQWRKEKEEGDA